MILGTGEAYPHPLRVQEFVPICHLVFSGMAAVGEGWISEMLLLQQIRDAFSGNQVVHQGRPKWLGAQSLDIYSPEANIGIEHQGAQHSGPVSLFGGPAAFERQVERDERKRELCRANNCELIEVFPDYEVSHVIARVQTAIEGSANPAPR